jgi:glycine cleavage system transcriptional repressor
MDASGVTGTLYAAAGTPYVSFMPHVILSAIGTDRPGLVDEVAQFIFDRGGNIEDSRSVNLRGQFAMVMLIGAGDSAIETMKRDTPALTHRHGLHAEFRSSAGAEGAKAEAALPLRLRATGIDQPGLVRQVAHGLREMNVNIESLDTKLTAAPYTGASVFEMEMVLAAPKQTQVAALRRRVGAICDELNLDWELTTL